MRNSVCMIIETMRKKGRAMINNPNNTWEVVLYIDIWDDLLKAYEKN